MRRIISTFLCFILAAGAQQVGRNTKPDPTAGGATFQTSTTLVVEAVTVKDKSGKPVEGLTKNDFTITEDGAPQMISFLEYQHLDDPETGAPPAPVPYAGNGSVLARLPRNAEIAPETPGKTRYKDKRLLALYFDMSNMPPADQFRALSNAQKFIKNDMTPVDLMAILQFSSGYVQVLQDFTDDRDKLLTIINTLTVGEDQDADVDASASDSGAAFGQNDAEFNLFNTDRQLSALQTAAKMLGTLNEKKALVYFASGLRLNGVDNQAQLHATENAAVRAGVNLWPIDARGLVASAPMGDATRGSQGGAGMYSGQGAMNMMSSFQRSQDTLWSLAADTGGKALLDYNDLSMGIVQAEKSIGSNYILGYYTSNDKLDGKFRRIKITLNSGSAATLGDYRQGYYAGKEFAKFTAADKERHLEEAFSLGDPLTELSLMLELDFFQINSAEYFIPVTVKIPGSELALAKKKGAEHTLLDFMLEVRDDHNSVMQNIREHMDVKLSDATAAELSKRPVEYPTGFTILPGKYKIKFLVSDAETGRIGTYETPFEIPNLNKVDKSVAISSVVLSSQRIDIRDALFNASKEKDKSEATNPLVQDGIKLIPSVTRVFSKTRDMYIYLQAYEHDVPATQPLVAYVTFYKGLTKAFETPPLPVTEGRKDKLKTVPLKFNLSLSQLTPGEYDCQVTVLDPTGQKAAYWQAPVMLVP